MKKKLVSVAIVGIVLAAAVAAMSQERQGYTRPELNGAISVTRAMLSPMRLQPQEVWYNALIQDPRHGEYKVGYMVQRMEVDGRGNLVITRNFRLVMKIYSVDFQTQEGTLVEKISMDTGRTMEVSMKGRLAGYTHWIFGVDLPMESMAIVDKKAVFDWAKGKVVVTYGDDPRAPVRTYDIEQNSVPPISSLLFMYKPFSRQEGKIYRFRFFDLYREKFDDIYVQYEGTRGKDVHKYSIVPSGWGDTWSESYWFGPPTDYAPNGFLHKIITNPHVDRYTTFLPVTKEKALEPVSAMLE